MARGQASFRRGRDVAELLGLAAAYLALAKAGLALASINPSASPIWPATGFALAAVLLRGYRVGPAIFLGAFLANETTTGSVATSLAIALGNTLEGVVGGYLIERWCHGRRAFDTTRSVARFALACLPATMISATIGVASLWLAGNVARPAIAGVWTTWWLGDIGGALLVTPALVLWLTSPADGLSRAEVVESLWAYMMAAAIGLVAFSPLLGTRVDQDPLGFLAILPLMVTAMRRPQRDTATAVLILSGFAIWGAGAGSGPFARGSVNASLLLLLMFIVSTSVPSLALSAEMAAQRRAKARLERRVDEGTAALRHSDEQFRRLVEGLGDYAIIMLDPAGVVASWNAGAERIKGYAAEEILGRHVACFYAEDDRCKGVPQEALAQAAKAGKHEAEGWHLRKDGSRFWASTLIDAIHDDNGQLVGFVKITRDMTERRAVEEQLLQSRKMELVGQLSGGIAHDFSNHLGIIIMSLEALRRRLHPASPDISRSIEMALQGAQGAAALTDRLLAFSRRRPLEPKLVDLNKLVAGMSELLQRSLGEAVVIETVAAAGLWRPNIDRSQIESAILNLALNARDAMPDGGRLVIATANVHLDAALHETTGGADDKDFVMISVSDTGTGMSPEVAAKAFEPFFTTKEVGRGTGLGLSQVHAFAKQSGGHVRLESAPGKGTTVRIYLPRAADAEPGSDATVKTLPALASRQTETILVVADQDELRASTVEPSLRPRPY